MVGEKTGGLQSVGSQGVKHDRMTNTTAPEFTFQNNRSKIRHNLLKILKYVLWASRGHRMRASWRCWDLSWISKDAKDQNDIKELGVREVGCRTKGWLGQGCWRPGIPFLISPFPPAQGSLGSKRNTTCIRLKRAAAAFLILSPFQVCILFSRECFFPSLHHSSFCGCNLNFSLSFKAFIPQVEGRNF